MTNPSCAIWTSILAMILGIGIATTVEAKRSKDNRRPVHTQRTKLSSQQAKSSGNAASRHTKSKSNRNRNSGSSSNRRKHAVVTGEPTMQTKLSIENRLPTSRSKSERPKSLPTSKKSVVTSRHKFASHRVVPPPSNGKIHPRDQQKSKPKSLKEHTILTRPKKGEDAAKHHSRKKIRSSQPVVLRPVQAKELHDDNDRAKAHVNRNGRSHAKNFRRHDSGKEVKTPEAGNNDKTPPKATSLRKIVKVEQTKSVKKIKKIKQFNLVQNVDRTVKVVKHEGHGSHRHSPSTLVLRTQHDPSRSPIRPPSRYEQPQHVVHYDTQYYEKHDSKTYNHDDESFISISPYYDRYRRYHSFSYRGYSHSIASTAFYCQPRHYYAWPVYTHFGPHRYIHRYEHYPYWYHGHSSHYYVPRHYGHHRRSRFFFGFIFRF